MIKKTFFLFFILAHMTQFSVSSLSVGSNSLFSRQAFVTFPTTDTDNTMLGFAEFEKGFRLTNNITTCTFNNLFPVSGSIDMNGGALYLLRDFSLLNSCDWSSGGRFFGNNYSVEFCKQVSPAEISNTLTDFSLVITYSTRVTGDSLGQTNSLQWNRNDTYIAAGTSNSLLSKELRLYYFDGSIFTTTLAQEIGAVGINLNTLDWNPLSNYLALTYSMSGANVRVRKLNISNGTFPQTGVAVVPGADTAAQGIAWHPSGSFLGAGGSNSTGNAPIAVFPFSQTTSLLGTPIVANIASIQVRCMQWAPGGNYLCVGSANNITVGVPEIFIYSFNGTSLTLSTSAEIGGTVTTIDWSPTGSYIAVAISGLTSNLRIYRHQAGAGILREQQSARQSISSNVWSVAWDNSGRYLLASLASGASSEFRIYYFNPLELTLTLVDSLPATSNINGVSWSKSNQFSSYLTQNTDVVITSTRRVLNFLFNNTSLIFNSDVNVNSPILFQGNCKINGRGKTVTIQSGGQMTVQPGANLILEDIVLEGLSGSNLRCLTDRGSMTLRNSILELARDYTFSRGSLLFDQDVLITGTSKFNYTSGLASTIATQSMLFLDSGITFSYQPRLAKNNLIFMTDVSSQLYLNGCTLYSSRTGLQLSTGTLIIDDKVTFTSEARSMSEALFLNSNLTARIRGQATAEFFGLIRYD